MLYRQMVYPRITACTVPALYPRTSIADTSSDPRSSIRPSTCALSPATSRRGGSTEGAAPRSALWFAPTRLTLQRRATESSVEVERGARGYVDSLGGAGAGASAPREERWRCRGKRGGYRPGSRPSVPHRLRDTP